MSRIEVDKIQQQCGTTLTVGGGACKTAVVDATTVTLGRCGGTVSLASGATQSGFGRAGSVDWQTGSIKTTTFSAVDGEGYFVDTNAGAVTVNLPAGSAGAIVAVADYTRTFNTYNCTVTPNGSEKIGGATGGQSAILDVAGQSATFVYVDSNEGWINVQETQTSQVGANPYVVATVSGACNTLATSCCGDYKIATFKNPGTFCVSNAGTPGGSNGVEYLVVAGGGASGYDNGGGGGAGGVRFAAPSIAPLTYPAKPLAGPAPIAVTASPYPITVGGGGPAIPFPSAPTTLPNGSPSTFDSITSAGGGFGSGCGGNMNPGPQGVGGPGGSGGGAGQKSTSSPMLGGTGNTPPTSPSQGTDGGPTVGTCNQGGAGGGGFVCAAAPKPAGNNNGSPGGDGGGFPTAFGSNGEPCGSYRYYGGGGGGGAGQPGTGTGGGPGLGGGGPGGSYSAAGGCGTANTGGGGGGAAQAANGSAGGSGIVVIRYKFQN